MIPNCEVPRKNLGVSRDKFYFIKYNKYFFFNSNKNTNNINKFLKKSYKIMNSVQFIFSNKIHVFIVLMI